MMKRLSSALVFLSLLTLPAYPQTPGTQKWALTTGNYVQSSPAIGPDGTIYVGSRDNKLYAVNANGTKKWEFTTGNYIYSSPAVAQDGTLYVGSRDNKVYAINPDGTQKWTFTTGMWVDSSPAIGSDGTIYIGSGDSKLYAINPDGTQKWAFTTGVTNYSSPTVGPDGTIYLSSWGNKLWAINPDGTQKWSITVGIFVNSSFSIGNDGTLYLGSHENKLYAIHEDGTIKWAYDSAGSGASSPAIGADGTIYTGSINHGLYAIDQSGNKKWVYETGNAVESSPAVGSDGTIYVGCNDQNVYAVHPDGTKKWTFATGGEVKSSPAIGADGAVYIGSRDKKLYAINSTSLGLASSPWPRFRQNNQNTGLLLALYMIDEPLFSFFTSGESGFKSIHIMNPFKKQIIIENAILDDPAFSLTSTVPVTISAGASLELIMAIQTDSSRLYQSRVQLTYISDGMPCVSAGTVSAGLMRQDDSEQALIFRRALDAYSKAQAKDAKSIAATNNLGVLYRTLSATESAGKKFMKALSSALNARYGYSGIMMNVGVVKSDQDSAALAYDYYNGALSEQMILDNSSALFLQVLYNNAWEHYAEDNLSDAVIELDFIVEHEKVSDFLKAKAFVLRGALNWRNQLKLEAIADFQQAISLDAEGPIGAMARENIQTLGTGIDIHPDIIPYEYKLMPNYPNPFNSETLIRFSLPRPSFVRITLHNVRGETVRSLVHQGMNAGWEEVKWDGRNHVGEMCASGIYIVRVECDGFVQMIKATLIK